MERWLTAEHEPTETTEPTAPGRDYEHMFSAASLPSNMGAFLARIIRYLRHDESGNRQFRICPRLPSRILLIMDMGMASGVWRPCEYEIDLVQKLRRRLRPAAGIPFLRCHGVMV